MAGTAIAVTEGESQRIWAATPAIYGVEVESAALSQGTGGAPLPRGVLATGLPLWGVFANT